MTQPTKFIQLSVVREDEGDNIYALDSQGTIWSYWTGKSNDKHEWRKFPTPMKGEE